MPVSKDYQAFISKQHYRKNKIARIAAARLARETQVLINKDYIDNYLKNHGCVDCGTYDNLEFHHRDASSKRASISTLVGGGYSLTSIITEIAKCDVLCRTHHLKHHYG